MRTAARPGILLATAAVLLGGLMAPAQVQAAGNGILGTSCPAFPADNWWHADVSRLPVHPHSGQWLSHMSTNRRLHPDFGPSYGAQPQPYGIPVTVVAGSHPKVTPSFTYASESDRRGYPLGTDTRIEGGSDRHAVVLDRDACRLYETWETQQQGGRWTAGSGAVWDLRSDALRPAGWTSADAAGLPILPGLLRYDEVKAGHVDHAIRFTTTLTDRSYLWPARHQAGSASNAGYPPMGARFRLKASYRVAPSLRPDTKVVLSAMKRYGLALADNGSPWYFQGTADNAWPSGLLDQLKAVPASAFEAVDTARLMVKADSGRAR